MKRARGNFAYLLTGLLVLWILSSFASPYPWLQSVALCLCLIVGVWSLGTRLTQVIGMTLATLAILFSSLAHTVAWQGLDRATLVVALLFFGLTGAIALRAVMAPGPVDRNRILGSICAYLVLGYCWAILYTFVWLNDGDAFRGITAKNLLSIDPDELTAFSEFLYFSFVTLTTLGYGDVRPVSDVARILAMLEATLGQLFLVIVVARLVGIHTVQAMRRDGET